MKKLMYLFTLILIALCISGCHGKESMGSFEVPTKFDTSRDYEITFWAKNDSNLTQKNIYQNAIDNFMKIYPNIHVTMVSYTDYNQIYNDVITNMATNTTPNVCITYPDHVATYKTGENIIIPLDNLINDQKYGLGGSSVKFDSPTKDEMVTKFVDECKLGDDQTYALPFMRSTEALYINKDYVEELGYTIPDVVTWDFIFEVADKAIEENDKYNKAQKEADPNNYKENKIIPIIYKSTDNMMIQMVAQKGYDYSTIDGDILLFSDENMEILMDIAPHAKNKAFSTFKISSYPGNTFNRGKCIFGIDSTAGSTWMGANAPLQDIPESEIADFETVVRPVPQYDTENVKMISQGPSLCLFNKEDEGEVLASWLFMEYLLTNDVQIAYSETEGYIPVTTKAQNSPIYQEYLNSGSLDSLTHYQVKIDATKMLLENIDNTFVTPAFNGSVSLRDAAGQLIEEVTRNAKKVDKDYIKNTIYPKVISLYRIGKSGKAKFTTLPKETIILFVIFGLTWAGIITYITIEQIKKYKINKREKK